MYESYDGRGCNLAHLLQQIIVLRVCIVNTQLTICMLKVYILTTIRLKITFINLLEVKYTLTFDEYKAQMLLLNSRDATLQWIEQLLEEYIEEIKVERVKLDQQRVKLAREMVENLNSKRSDNP